MVHRSLLALGDLLINDVGVLDLNVDTRGFHWWDSGPRAFQSEWTDDGVQFQATLQQPVGQVTLHAVAINQPGYLRVEAYDADGQFLGRVTSDAIELGPSVPVTIDDPLGSITRVVAYGHAGIGVGLTGLEYGQQGIVQSSAGGTFQFLNLADGT